MRRCLPCLFVFAALTMAACSAPQAPGPSLAPPSGSVAASWKNCSAYKSQPQAQEAWLQAGRPKSADRNQDGIVCNSLPGKASSSASKSCLKQPAPRSVLLNRAKYPETSLHIEKSISMGQPAMLTVQRDGTDAKRNEWHQVVAEQNNLRERNLDQDEWPMAFSAQAGRNANIALIDAGDNRGAGSSIASQMSGYCDGQQFKIKMYGARLRPVTIIIIANKGRRTSITVTG
jgi:hypothetical protein